MDDNGPEEILKLARNFMECRILLSGAELNLFSILKRESLSAQAVSGIVGADLRAIKILLDALAAVGLLTKENEKYRCPASVAPLLSDDDPESVLPMVLHAAHLWRRWSRLTTVVTGAKDSEELPGLSRSASEMRAFIGAMHVVAQPRAHAIVAQINPGPAKALIDVGGASGTYTIAFLQTAPDMKATLFDRPEVVEMARERLMKAGMLDRVNLVSGDFYQDEFPPGHDLAFVSAIIHQNSLEENTELFRKVFRSLNGGGRIVIRDHVMEPDRVRPKNGAVFAVNMLLGTPGGGTYTLEEIGACLSGAGFGSVGLVSGGENMDAIVEAFKP
jgi:predicted O-methyltransferase YrrM